MATEMRAFVDAKRALGRRFITEEKALRLFDRFLAQRCVNSIVDVTPAVVDSFLASRSFRRARSYNMLLGVVRGLFDWLVRQDCLPCSPVRTKPRRQTARRIPCLLDPANARRLLDIASHLPDRPRAPLRGPTYRTIFALLYGLGLRVGEVSRLRCADVDFGRQLLVVRDTKFGKSRLVPFGPRIGALLHDYLQLRGSKLAPDAPVFSFTRRGAVHPGTISQTFHQLVPQLGLSLPPGVAPPRVHDLRHAFAVGTLLRWYREGVNPAARLFHLSTFLGHVNPTSTAVYLTITFELLAAANRRFEGFAAPAFKGVSS
ncbi:tyrosine-type recombinase/integrase [Sorangium sp. So ce1389]|uniref:tyrosine-type recombinase/integrase n=1 Tax=Sorangium sp. So ce1389 TaxID=3133336 RepID=UPI003F608FE3